MKNIIFISPNSFLKILSVVIVLLTLASAAGSLSEQLSIDNYLLEEARDAFIRLFIVTGEAECHSLVFVFHTTTVFIAIWDNCLLQKKGSWPLHVALGDFVARFSMLIC